MPECGNALAIVGEDPNRKVREGTGGTETSKYPEEKKSSEIPQVAASERGGAQTGPVVKPAGVAGPGSWERRAGAADPAPSEQPETYPNTAGKRDRRW